MKGRKPKRKVNRNHKCGVCGLPRRKHKVLGHNFAKREGYSIDR